MARVVLDPLKQIQSLLSSLSSHLQAKSTDPQVLLLGKTPLYILAKTAKGQVTQVVTAQDDWGKLNKALATIVDNANFPALSSWDPATHTSPDQHKNWGHLELFALSLSSSHPLSACFSSLSPTSALTFTPPWSRLLAPDPFIHECLSAVALLLFRDPLSLQAAVERCGPHTSNSAQPKQLLGTEKLHTCFILPSRLNNFRRGCW